MPDVALGLIIPSLSFVIQTWPRWTNRWFGIDAWRHLAAADHIRRTGRIFDSMPEHYLIEKPSDYPPLLRVILAAFPKRWVERSQWYLSALIDASHNMLVFGAAYCLTRHVGVAMMAQLCYSLSPLVIMENVSLTTRSISSLLFSAAVLPLVLFLGTRQPIWFILGTLALGLLFLAHRLAIQALVVLVAVLAIAGRTPWPMAYMAAGMVLALVMSRGHYARILSGHIAMLVCWRRNIQDRFAHQVRGVLSTTQQDPDPVFRIYQAIRRLPVVAVLGAHPTLPLILAAYVWLTHRGLWHGWGIPDWMAHWWVVWAATLWIAGLAVRQIPAVRFLGEGERYVEYANAPAALVGGTVLVSAWHDPRTAWVGWGLLAVMIIGGWLPALAIQRAVVLRDTERSITPALRGLFDILNAQTQDVRLLTMPTYLADAAMYFTKSRVVSTDNSHAHNTHYDGLWPRLKRPFSEFIVRYRINFVLINQKYVSLAELQLDESQVIHRADNYCLLAIQ